MRIKRPGNIEFNAFKDGMCSIYTESEEENEKTYKYKNIHFDNRMLGFKRVYAAKSANSNINRVIRIPDIPYVDNYDCVEITGDNCYYTIELVQKIYDANPVSLDLTLKKVGIQ